jgi:hypothetical protein
MVVVQACAVPRGLDGIRIDRARKTGAPGALFVRPVGKGDAARAGKAGICRDQGPGTIDAQTGTRHTGAHRASLCRRGQFGRSKLGPADHFRRRRRNRDIGQRQARQHGKKNQQKTHRQNR